MLLRGLDEHERRGARPLPDPIPVADSIAAALRHRLEAVPPTTLDALVVLAADTGSSPAALPRAMASLGLDVGDLEPAEDVAIVVRSGGRPAFAHPLLRASALSMAKPSRLRAIHRAFAAAHEEAGELEPRAWQLAAAASGPDDEAADALAEVAAAARRRGATAVAADGYLTAARLSSRKADRAARLLAAGDAIWVVGRVEEATEVLDEALEASESARERADIAILLGKIELWAKGPRVARDRFLGAVGPLELDDPDLASKLVSQAAGMAFVSGDVTGSLDLGRHALALLSGDDLAAVGQATLILGHLEAHAADPGAADRLQPIVDIAELLVDSEDPEVVGLLGIVGMCLVEAERLEEAERFLAAVVRRSRREGASASGAFGAAILAEKHWRTGNWLEAAHLSSTDVVDGATMLVNQAWTAAFLAHLDAVRRPGRALPSASGERSAHRRGDRRRCRAHLGRPRHGAARSRLRPLGRGGAPPRPGGGVDRVARPTPPGRRLVAGRPHRGPRTGGPSRRRRSSVGAAGTGAGRRRAALAGVRRGAGPSPAGT